MGRGIEKDSLMNNLALARRTDWANIDAQSSSDTGASLAMKRQASANNARNLIDVAAKMQHFDRRKRLSYKTLIDVQTSLQGFLLQADRLKTN